MDLPRRNLSDTTRKEPYRDSHSLVSVSGSSTRSPSHSFESLCDTLGTSDSEVEDADGDSDSDRGVTPTSKSRRAADDDRTPTPSPQRRVLANVPSRKQSLPSPSPSSITLTPLRLPKRTPVRERERSPLIKRQESPRIRLTKNHAIRSPTYLDFDFDQTYPDANTSAANVPLPCSPLPRSVSSPAGQGIGLENGDPFAAVPSPRVRAGSSPSPLRREAMHGLDEDERQSVMAGDAILSSFPVPPAKDSPNALEMGSGSGASSPSAQWETSPSAKRSGAVFGGVDIDIERGAEAAILQNTRPARPSTWRSEFDPSPSSTTQRKTSSTLRFALSPNADADADGSDGDDRSTSSSSFAQPAFPITPPAVAVDPGVLMTVLVEHREGMQEMRRFAEEIRACVELFKTPPSPVPSELPAAFIEALPDVLSLLLTLDGLVHHVALSERSCEQVFDRGNLKALRGRVAGWERIVRGISRCDDY